MTGNYFFINHTLNVICLTHKNVLQNVTGYLTDAVLLYNWSYHDIIELYYYNGNVDYIRSLIINEKYDIDNPALFLNEKELADYMCDSLNEDDNNDF
jgi:hypothetical protein